MESVELICECLPWEGQRPAGEGYVVLVEDSSFGIDSDDQPFYSYASVPDDEHAIVLLDPVTLKPALVRE